MLTDWITVIDKRSGKDVTDPWEVSDLPWTQLLQYSTDVNWAIDSERRLILADRCGTYEFAPDDYAFTITHIPEQFYD